MRQRNDTDYELVVGTDPVTLLAPDETIDHPDHISGLTPVDDVPAEPAPDPSPPPQTTASKAVKTTPTAAKEATP